MNLQYTTRAAVLSVALALGAATSHAQPAPAERAFTRDAQAAVDEELEEAAYQAILEQATNGRATIIVKNTMVRFVAYWLDPARNPIPPQIQSSKNNGGGNYGWASDVEKMTRQPGNGNGPRGLEIPDGIESIVVDEPGNALLVKGTAASIKELLKLVKEIDVPIGHVEIEAQVWEIAPAEFAKLPLNFRNASRSTAAFNDGAFGELAFAPLEDDMTDINKQLQFWSETERAKLVTTPRVTAMDGLAASLSTTETRSFNINAMEESKDEPEAAVAEDEDEIARTAPIVKPEKKAETFDDNWKLGVSRIHSEWHYKFLPVLHGDLIALAYEIVFDNQITTASTIMRDGQTLPVRLGNARKNNGWVRLVLLRPRRIVR